MKIEKLITIKQESNMEITGATLLSSEEYNNYKNRIPHLDKNWWLRSPGYDDALRAVCVFGDFGFVFNRGDIVYGELGVRPALQINLSSSNLSVGDEFVIGEHKFTVISESYAISNSDIGYYPFRKDSKADNANNYEVSDVKKFVDEWYEELIKEHEISKEEEIEI